MAITESNRHLEGNISTIFEKLDPHIRKKIDTAIIKRDPASVRAIHEKFKLAEKDISYQVLYRYARRLRDDANKMALLESTFSSEIDIAEHLKNQIGRLCVDQVLNLDNPSMLDAHRATLAYHKALQFAKTIKETEILTASTPAPPPPEPVLTRSQKLQKLEELKNDLYAPSPTPPGNR